MKSKYISVALAAKKARVNRSTIRKYAKQGTLRSITIPICRDVIMIDEDSIEDFKHFMISKTGSGLRPKWAEKKSRKRVNKAKKYGFPQ